MLCLVALVSFAWDALGDVTIGISTPSGPDKLQQEWGPLAAYLGDRLGETVKLVPVSPTEFRDFCDAFPQGFLFHNPWVYIRAKVLKGAEALLTVEYRATGARFGGVVFCRHDCPVASLKDLTGKVVVCYQFSSLGAWLIQKGEMVKHGINPEKDCKRLLEAPDQEQVVLMVKNGLADAGTVRTGILEKMARKRKIRLEEFRVLNEQHHHGFEELCSSPLYPEWAFARLKATPPGLSTKVKELLLGLPPDHPSLQNAGVQRFVEALDYASVEELCRRLQVPPFSTRK